MSSLSFDHPQKPLSVSLSSTHSSEDHLRSISVQESVIQKINAQCELKLGGLEKKEAAALFKNVLDGEVRYFSPSLTQYDMPSLPNFPLNPTEEAQCWKLLETAPICLKYLTVGDALNFQVYRALNFLVKEGKISSSLLRQFCKDCVIGNVSQLIGKNNKTVSLYTSSQLIAHMEKTLQEIVHSATKKNKKKYPLHYEQAINGISIFLKICRAHDSRKYLQDCTCLENEQVAAHLPLELEDPEQTYLGVIEFIDFITYGFSETQHFQTTIQESEHLCHLMCTQEEVSKWKENVLSEFRRPNRKERSITSLMSIQKKLLENSMLIFEKNIKSLQQANQRTLVNCALSKKMDEKREVTFVYYTCAAAEIDNITYLLDSYVLKLIPEYITIKARFYRIGMAQNFFCHSLLNSHTFISRLAEAGKLKSITSIIDAQFIPLFIKLSTQEFNYKLQFLSKDNKLKLANCMTLFAQELLQAFAPEQALIAYATKIKNFGSQLNSQTLHLIEYQMLYKLITPWIKNLYGSVEGMQKAHSQVLIKFLDDLSLENCRLYQAEILEAIEEALLEQIVPIYMAYMIYQDLHCLTQNAHVKQPLSFCDTPIASYLLMEDFERALFKKISLDAESGLTPEEAGLPSSSEFSIHLPLSLKEQEQATPTPSSSIKADSLTLAHQEFAQDRRNRDRSKVHETKRKATPPSFGIRRGEKLRKILKKLKELGLEITRQKGSHARLQNSHGEGVTVSKHGEGRPLTSTVRRGLEKQVNGVKEKTL